MRARVIACVVALLVTLGLHGFAAWRGEPAQGVIDPARVRHDGGQAFAAPLTERPARWLAIPNDGAGLSVIEVVEVDGAKRTPLGPGHAPPDLVRERGGGAFNHWGELLFSSSDGSDPRTNGRRYEWTSATSLHPRLGLLMLAITSGLLLWTLSGWFARMPIASPIVFSAVTALLLVAWNLEAMRLYPGWINVDWDTASYLGRSPERTIGYPIFLNTVTAVAGDLRPLLFVQLNLMLLAFAWLGVAVNRLLKTRVVGLAIVVLLATSPRLLVFPFNVLTEAPYVIGTCVMLALLAEVARWRGLGETGASADSRAIDAPRRPGSWSMMLLLGAIGATLALTELVRPAAFGLAPMALLPVLWMRGQRIRSLAALVLPYAVLIGAAAWANHQRYGFFATSSMGPVSLLGHVAWNIRAETCPSLPELAARIEQRVAPIIAKRPADLPWPKEYFFWTSDEYNDLLWSNAMPETQAWVEAHRPPGSTEHEAIELRRIRGTLAREAMRADLPAYLRHVGAHVWGFWQSAARPAPLGPALKGRVPRGIGSVENLWPEVRQERFGWLGAPPETERSDTPFDRMSWMERWRAPLDSNPSLLWKVALVFTVAGLVLAPFVRWLPPAARLLALAGTGFQGTAVLVAAAAAVIARYVDAVEPLTVVACAAGVTALVQMVSRARPSRAGEPQSHPR
ncbi:MAG: hypothetical protein KF724_01610 [Phycisphaeraceae bacterium]|nr:hypothetical protein [Phycisphaeraceae bacterium]